MNSHRLPEHMHDFQQSTLTVDNGSQEEWKNLFPFGTR